MSLKVGDFMKEAKFQCEKFYSWLKHQNYISQEHCTNWVTGFLIPIWKLILVPLITFFGNFAMFFGNNFLLLQHFLIRKLLLDKVILPSC